MIKNLLLLLLLGFTWQLTSYEIILPSPASSTELEASKLLREVLPLDTEIICDNKVIKEIHIGKSQKALKNINFEAFQTEMYLQKSENNIIYLTGNDDRGTFYAVASFLEEYLGMRVWNSIEKYIPKAPKTLSLKKLDKKHVSPFVMRHIYNDYFNKFDTGLFAAFNRFNNYEPGVIQSKFGGMVKIGKPYSVHTFAHYFPEKEYFAKHPEYFALINGKRKAGGQSQLCLSNPEVLKLTISKLKDFIVQDEKRAKELGIPAPLIYDISANDNNRICQCENCKKIIEQETEQSGLILYFVNKVAKEIKTYRPNIRISTLAYMNTEFPPKNIRPEKNVIIRLCNVCINYFANILAPENSTFREKIEKWNAVGAHIYIWDYSIMYYTPDLPYPSEYNYQETFKYYRDNNVKYLFMEHEKPERADMHTYKSYIEAKLMENPDANFEKISKDFLDGYYGKAGKFIAEYRKLLKNAVEQNNSFSFNYITSVGAFDFIDANVATKSKELLLKGCEAVKDDPEKLARVKRVMLNLNKAIYVLSRRWSTQKIDYNKDFLDPKVALKEAEVQWNDAIKKFIVEKYQHRKVGEVKKEIKFFSSLPATIEPSNKFANVKRKVEYLPELINANTYCNRNKIVLDASSKTTYTVEVNNEVTKSLHFGVYNVAEGKLVKSGFIPFEKLKIPGYHWYKVLDFTPVPGGYIYLIKNWTVQLPQDNVASISKKNEQWSLYVRAKFTGKSFNDGSGNDKILLDRFILIPKK